MPLQKFTMPIKSIDINFSKSKHDHKKDISSARSLIEP